MLETIVPLFGVLAMFLGWLYGRRLLLGPRVTLHSVEAARRDWKPREEEWTVARLRRARTLRYQSEHLDWLGQFQALGGVPPRGMDPTRCPHCSGKRPTRI